MPQAIRYPTSSNFVQKTLGAALLSGVTAAATFNNVTNVQNKPGVFIVDRIDTNGVETPLKREVIQYTATSGLTVTTLTRNADSSGTDQDHAVGAIVEFVPDALWAQSIVDGLTATVVASTGLLDTTKVVAQGGTGASLTLISPTFSGPIINPTIVNGTFASLPVFTGQARMMGGVLTPFVTLTDSANMYLDMRAGTKFTVNIATAGIHNFLATNATVGSIAMLQVQFASSISMSINLFNTNASTTWPGGTAPTLTNTTLKNDMFGLVCIGTLPRFAGFIVGQNY